MNSGMFITPTCLCHQNLAEMDAQKQRGTPNVIKLRELSKTGFRFCTY